MITVKKVNIEMMSDTVTKRIPVMQNDSGRGLECNILDWQIPDGTTAKIWALKPSENLIYNECTIDGNSVIVPLTNQTLAEIGTVICKLEFEKAGEKVSSYEFVLDVKRDISGNGTESKNESTVLEKMFEEFADYFKLRRIEKSNMDTVVELEGGNQYYVFPEMLTLTYTIKGEEEVHFFFRSGETATEVVHPSGVNIGDFIVEANRIYEVSILENCLTWQSWEVVVNAA